jgi:hypothetical protein
MLRSLTKAPRMFTWRRVKSAGATASGEVLALLGDLPWFSVIDDMLQHGA